MEYDHKTNCIQFMSSIYIYSHNTLPKFSEHSHDQHQKETLYQLVLRC